VIDGVEKDAGDRTRRIGDEQEAGAGRQQEEAANGLAEGEGAGVFADEIVVESAPVTPCVTIDKGVR
jgi:hypothetical protein